MLSLSRQLKWTAHVHSSKSPQKRFDLVKMWLLVGDNPIGMAHDCLVTLTIRNPGKGGAAEPPGLVKLRQHLHKVLALLGEGYQCNIERLISILGLVHPGAGRYVPQGRIV